MRHNISLFHITRFKDTAVKPDILNKKITRKRNTNLNAPGAIGDARTTLQNWSKGLFCGAKTEVPAAWLLISALLCWPNGSFPWSLKDQLLEWTQSSFQGGKQPPGQGYWGKASDSQRPAGGSQGSTGWCKGGTRWKEEGAKGKRSSGPQAVRESSLRHWH